MSAETRDYEIGHALGLWPDQIVIENIETGRYHAFMKMKDKPEAKHCTYRCPKMTDSSYVSNCMSSSFKCCNVCVVYTVEPL